GQLWRNGLVVSDDSHSEAMNYEMTAVTVLEHQLWVMGDNRNESLDSHLWGPLPEELVIGTAIWRYWPLNQFGRIRFPLQHSIGKQDPTAIGSAM
ncbi:MAG: S26 family signal peptidase, partial [Prochlorococcus sp.]